MEERTSIDDIANDTLHDTPHKDDATFQAAWQAADIARLQPTNLPIARAQRAWERKPLSPFSRRKVRVGKVWKRATTGFRLPTTVEAEGMAAKRLRLRDAIHSPMKPVKKLCMGSSFGMGASVAVWEDRGSPVRKIVTRSSAIEDDLTELEEEDADVVEGEGGDVTIEILDENGNVLNTEVQDDSAGDQWADVQDEAEREEDVLEATGDTTAIHPTDVSLLEETPLVDEVCAVAAQDSSDDVPAPSETIADTATANTVLEVEAAVVNQESPTATTGALDISLADVPHVPAPTPSQASVLPDGFVSPVKQRRKLGPRSLRAVAEARRRTLPVQFAPAVELEKLAATSQPKDITVSQPEVQLEAQHEEELENQREVPLESLEFDGAASQTTVDMPDESAQEAMQDEPGWEDVEDETDEDIEADSADNIEQHDDPYAHDHIMCEAEESIGAEAESVENDAREAQPEEVDTGNMQHTIDRHHMDVEDQLASGPVPTIEKPHSVLPLRRSPRRKSSSPLKQSSQLSLCDKPHLVAFTPIRRPASWLHDVLSTEDAPIEEDLDMEDEEPASPTVRSVSAPPEEPQMSPRKTAKPRVSDDTALLQAFLNRAAENKSSRRRSSVAKRESITNRRDSDTVRQALASPRKPAEVLMDLDPNSPSPRKQLSGDTATGEEEFIEDSHEATKPTRRSGRGRRAPQTLLSQTAPSARSKITIRGPASGVEVKGSEATLLARLTKENTRKNKIGCVLPALRMETLVGETVAFELESAFAQDPRDEPGRRGVKWAETLASFMAAPEPSESSQLSDEPEERMPWERPSGPSPPRDTAGEADELAGPPPAVDTPSKPKPKLRRLKPPRPTAATAAAELTAKTEEPPLAPEISEAKPVPKPRRSRIATPAKGLLTNASLLPTDVPTSEPAQPVPRKRLASKLPARAPSLAPTTMLGKENANSIISSPPKKKKTTGVPTATTFAPKLDFGGPIDKIDLPILASPAKKGRKAVVSTSDEGAAMGNGGSAMDAPVALLSSPAKKRSRRGGMT